MSESAVSDLVRSLTRELILGFISEEAYYRAKMVKKDTGGPLKAATLQFYLQVDTNTHEHTAYLSVRCP